MKKSYKGFVLWTILYMAGFIPIVLAENLNGNTVTRLCLIYTSFAVTLLTYIIYRSDKIYWYNGVTFEDAENAGYERRQIYAYRHLCAFGRFTVFYTVFSCFTMYAGLSLVIDGTVFTAGLIATAISTVKIKL